MSAAEAMYPPLEVVARVGPVLIVPAGVESLGYIVSGWCRSYEPVACASLGLPPPESLPPGTRRLLCAGIHATVKALLGRASMRALVAVAEEAPTVILGYVVFEPSAGGMTVHYAYVDKTVRRQGLARALLEAAGAKQGGTYSHHTPAGAALVRRYRLTYQPETHPCPKT